jgi:hypothetical protein
MKKKSEFLDEVLFKIVSGYVDYVKEKNSEVKAANDAIRDSYFQL